MLHNSKTSTSEGGFCLFVCCLFVFNSSAPYAGLLNRFLHSPGLTRSPQGTDTLVSRGTQAEVLLVERALGLETEDWAALLAVAASCITLHKSPNFPSLVARCIECRNWKIQKPYLMK